MQKKNVQQLFIMYGCVLFYIVFLTPNRYEGTDFRGNFIPLLHTAERIQKPAGEHFWKYYIEYWGNIFGNVILFMPFGFFMKWLSPDGKSKMILWYALLISMGIELVQWWLQIGVCDIDDVILNVSGTYTGIFLYQIVRNRIITLLKK